MKALKEENNIKKGVLETTIKHLQKDNKIPTEEMSKNLLENSIQSLTAVNVAHHPTLTTEGLSDHVHLSQWRVRILALETHHNFFHNTTTAKTHPETEQTTTPQQTEAQPQPRVSQPKNMCSSTLQPESQPISPSQQSTEMVKGLLRHYRGESLTPHL